MPQAGPTPPAPLPTDARALLAAVPLFAGAATETLEALAAAGRFVSAPRGKLLFLHGDRAAAAYIVQSGHVRLFRETDAGAEVVLDISGPGALFGETALFEDDTYPYSADILKDAELLALPLSVLDDRLDRDAVFCRALLAHTAHRERDKNRELELRALQDAPQRIGCFLLRLASGMNTERIVIKLPYDKVTIAARLGMRPETFSRALTKLKTDLDLGIDGNTLTIPDIAALARYVCAACSNSYPCGDGAGADGSGTCSR